MQKTSGVMLAVVTNSPSPHKMVFTIFVHSDVIVAGISVLVALALLAVVNVLVIVHAERLVVVQRLTSFTLINCFFNCYYV